MGLTVVCSKWYDQSGRYNDYFLYKYQHVNTLYSMVKRHIPDMKRFVCVTDDASGLNKDIDTVPINKSLYKAGERYPKLDVFRPDAERVFGKYILHIDLDCVIVDNLDGIIDYSVDFKILQSTWHKSLYNSSMIFLRAGARPNIYNWFDPIKSPSKVRGLGYGGSDQAWISYMLGRGERTWGRKDGVLSYKRDVKHKGLARNAKVVFFQGTYDPSMKSLQQTHPWIKEHWK